MSVGGWIWGSCESQRSAATVIRWWKACVCDVQGTKYSIWRLSDLVNCDRSVSFFLFNTVHRDLWKTTVGSVIGILNASVMQSSDSVSSGRLLSSSLSLSLSFPVGVRGCHSLDRLQKGPRVEGRLSWCSWWMIVPACVTGSKVEDTALSRHRLHSVGTLETVVVRYGEGSWPEADCGPSSTGQQWCTGFWSSQISSLPAGWCLQSKCDEWLSAGRECSGSETPPAPSSGSGSLPLPDRQELMTEEGWSPAWLPDLPVCCLECQYEMESTECGYWKFYWLDFSSPRNSVSSQKEIGMIEMKT